MSCSRFPIYMKRMPIPVGRVEVQRNVFSFHPMEEGQAPFCTVETDRTAGLMHAQKHLKIEGLPYYLEAQEVVQMLLDSDPSVWVARDPDPDPPLHPSGSEVRLT